MSVSERKHCIALMKAQIPSSSSTFYNSWFSSESSGISNFHKLLTSSDLDVKQHQIEGVQWLVNKELEKNNQGNVGNVGGVEGVGGVGGVGDAGNEGNGCPVGGILADEMGLGKTLQIIGTMACNFKFKTLIVVPCALLDQWVDAVQKYLKLKPFIFHSSYNTKQDSYNFAVTITTYGMISKQKAVLTSQKWGRVVFDEAHHLRNTNNETYKGATKLRTDIFWFISGTPIQNKFTDINSLLFLLHYNRDHLKHQGLVRDLIKPIIMKRTKESVNLVMPPISHHNIYIDWKDDDEHTLALEMHQISTLTDPQQNSLYTEQDKIVTILRARQSCIDSLLIPPEKRRGLDLPDVSTKLQRVYETAVGNGFHNPKLIFCQFRHEIDKIYNCFNNHDIKIGVFDGRTTPLDRKNILNQHHDVLILQFQCACEGLNLQHYNEIYFVSPHWNPAVQQQAIARCHRIGQTKHVHVYNFYMKAFGDESSMDIVIKNTQERKLKDFI